jgi:hypothetical protein
LSRYAQILIHRKGGKSDVDPIQVSDQEEQKNERQDGGAQLMKGGSFEIGPGECWGSGRHDVFTEPRLYDAGRKWSRLQKSLVVGR